MMYRRLERAFLTCYVCCCMLAFVAGCNATPSSTAPRTVAPSATRSAFEPLSIIAPAGILPSPDGDMLAIGSLPTKTVSLFSLDGTRLGQYEPHAGNILSYMWLPDSSGIVVWSMGQAGQPGPVVVLDRHGQITTTALQGVEPAPSPDSAWIAAGVLDTSNQEVAVQVVARSGGAVRTLVHGDQIRLLSWLGDRVIYASGDAIAAIPVTGGPSRSIGAPPSGNRSFITGDSYRDSPDGTVIVLDFPQGPQARVTEAGVFGVPIETVRANPVYWLGGHTALGEAQDTHQLAIIDLATGQSSSTGATSPSGPIAAVSGAWLVWSDPNETTYSVTDITTGRTHTVGPPPGDETRVAALSDGKFVFWDGSGKTFLFDANELT